MTGSPDVDSTGHDTLADAVDYGRFATAGQS
jgi:hypothetical protein